jgi:hypothetical protein
MRVARPRVFQVLWISCPLSDLLPQQNFDQAEGNEGIWAGELRPTLKRYPERMTFAARLANAKNWQKPSHDVTAAVRCTQEAVSSGCILGSSLFG